MSNIGVIINPKSGRGRGKGLALAEALKQQSNPAVDVVMIDAFAALQQALQRFASNSVETIFISSGDGTVHAIQTWLAEEKAFRTLPRLCLLPHGTTNMTAADLGFQRKSIMDQTQFISSTNINSVSSRPTLRISNAKNTGPLHGMFFGVGALAHATRYAQTRFNDKGVGGNLAGLATMISVFGKALFAPENLDDPARFDKPNDITVKIDGNLVCEGQQLLMLATTLEKLILGSKPFWGGAKAPIRTTTIPYPLPSIPRWIGPVLFGSEHRNAPPGSTSTACRSCDVTCPSPFVIDGEFYDAPNGEPLRLETGPAFEYIIA